MKKVCAMMLAMAMMLMLVPAAAFAEGEGRSFLDFLLGETASNQQPPVAATAAEGLSAAAVPEQEADKYPDEYLKHLESLQMTIDEEEYNYMAQMYAAYGMNFEYSSVMAYKGAANTEEYEKILQEAAEKACLNNMACQELADQAGISVSEEDYQSYLTENQVSEETAEEYGKPYIIQQYILPEKVKSYIAEHATVE